MLQGRDGLTSEFPNFGKGPFTQIYPAGADAQKRNFVRGDIEAFCEEGACAAMINVATLEVSSAGNLKCDYIDRILASHKGSTLIKVARMNYCQYFDHGRSNRKRKPWKSYISMHVLIRKRANSEFRGGIKQLGTIHTEIRTVSTAKISW